MEITNSVNGPVFLGIGAPRAGTTWLHKNLKGHPELWLPAIKELHYWDYQRPGAVANYPVPNARVKLSRLYWRWRHTKQLARRSLGGGVPPTWALRYLFGLRSDRWYARLFPNDRVAGEITPGYMLAPKPVIEAIHHMNPKLKVILLLRNPVSRAWSNLRLTMGPRIMHADDETILAGMQAPGFRLRSDYVRTIANWRSVFDPKQIFIGFYDDLVADPRGLLRAILTFLGVDASDARIPADIDRVVNKSKNRELPEHLLPRLYAPYLPQLGELEKMVGGPVSRWLAKAEQAVAVKPSVVAAPDSPVYDPQSTQTRI